MMACRPLGIEAQMAERGRPEEKIGGKASAGLIDIRNGPIRWINVCSIVDPNAQSFASADFTDYGVPDPRLEPNFPKYLINGVRVKTFPLFGGVVDLRWEGDDSNLGIISRLNSDTSLKDPIMSGCDVTIWSHGDHGCWTIETKTKEPPSEELWNCYQAIAKHLLSEWPDQKTEWCCVKCGSEITEGDWACPNCGVESEEDEG